MPSHKLALGVIICCAATTLLPAQTPPQQSTQPAPQILRPARPKPHPPVKPPHWGQLPTQRPSYNFRPSDPAYLRKYYTAKLARIHPAQRTRVVIGGYFPWLDIRYIERLPSHVYSYLPAPPRGYALGYYDGYVLVYSPTTFYIANVIDLLQ